MTDKIKLLLTLTLLLILIPTAASANIVWPSLYIAEGLRSWYIILCGLIIEFIFIKLFAKKTLLKSALISLVMNTISTSVGIILIPVTGLLGELVLAPFDSRTFAISHWLLSYILAVFGNVLTEGLTVRYIFKIRKSFLWLAAANAMSVIICILSYGITLERLIKIF